VVGIIAAIGLTSILQAQEPVSPVGSEPALKRPAPTDLRKHDDASGGASSNTHDQAKVFVEQPVARIKIGPAFEIGGEPRFPVRSSFHGMMIVEFSETPYIPISRPNDEPPPVEELIGKLDDQVAFDEKAQPGEYVTPPAASR